MKIFSRSTKRKRRATRNKKAQEGSLDRNRFRLVTIFFYTLICIVTVRAVFIHLFPAGKDTLKTIAKSQYQRSIDLAPYRGSVFDRRDIPLAISIRTPSLAINPRVFNPTSSEVRKLSKLLHISESKIRTLSKKKRYFAWLKRRVPHITAKSITSLELKGLHQFMEPARYYPGAKVAAHLLGYVGMDNEGLLGLELKYDKFLKGQENKVIHSKDARGRSIFFNSSAAKPEKAGNNIYLTIDQAIQEITEDALMKSVNKSDAKGGYAIVADPYTGRILALANYPTFDPNDSSSFKIENTRNQAVSNVFEPGSVMKPFVIAAALEKNLTTRDTLHDCEKRGVLKIGKRNWIHDDHPKEFLTTSEVLIHSSNICTFKIANLLGRQGLYETYQDFGFATDGIVLGLGGESHGRLSKWETWRPIRYANIAFGQGHLVTGIEVLRAYSVFANGGFMITPHIVDRIESEKNKVIQPPPEIKSRRILSSKVAKEMRVILGEVVSKGTASRAATKDYTTGGKTGTAEKVDAKLRAYSKNKRTASFAGIAPVDDPHIVIYVVIDEPGKKPYYGGLWAAPVFSEISQKTLKYLNVASDKSGPISLNSGSHVKGIHGRSKL